MTQTKQSPREIFNSFVEQGMSQEDANTAVRELFPLLKIGNTNFHSTSDLEIDELKPELIDEMTPLETGDALAESEKISNSKPKVVKEGPVFSLRVIKKGEKITLGQLLPLEKAPIKDAIQGVRAIDKDNLEKLVVTFETGKGDTVPPIKLRGCAFGMGPDAVLKYIIVAGHHRTLAMFTAIQNRYLSNPLMVDDKGKLLPEYQQKFEEEISRTQVRYEAMNALSEYDIPAYAYQDNFKHGLSPNGSGRSNHGLWLIKRASEQGIRMTLQQAADIVGVSKVAICRQQQRNNDVKPTKRTAVVPETALTQEDVKFIESIPSEDKSPEDPLVTVSNSIVKNAIKLALMNISVSELNAYFQLMIKDDATYNAVISLARILQVIPPKQVVTNVPETE